MPPVNKSHACNWFNKKLVKGGRYVKLYSVLLSQNTVGRSTCIKKPKLPFKPTHSKHNYTY